MKVIFLDIDGVLNSDDNERSLGLLWKNSNGLFKSKDRFGYFFDERCVRWLEYIIMMTNAKIVISSSWRYLELEALRTMWAERELPGDVIDTTSIDEAEDYGKRGDEIQRWIDLNAPENYCIIDDWDQMLSGQNFVKIDSEFGLTEEKTIKIILILNNG